MDNLITDWQTYWHPHTHSGYKILYVIGVHRPEFDCLLPKKGDRYIQWMGVCMNWESKPELMHWDAGGMPSSHALAYHLQSTKFVERINPK